MADDRGVDSLEALALVTTAMGAVPYGSSDPDRAARLEQGYLELTNSTNRYLQNLVNVKIEVPCDDNYSDDELTYFPYYSWLGAGLAPTPLPGPKDAAELAIRSVGRTFEIVRSLRSDLWCVCVCVCVCVRVYMSLTSSPFRGQGSDDGGDRAAVSGAW